MSVRFNRLLLLSATALTATLAMGGSALAGEIAGRVTVDGGLRALAGAEVEIVELGRKAATQADGSFRFADVTAGSYTLRTSYSAGQEQQQPVTVLATGTITANVLYGSGDQMAELIVVGQRANLASAISRQRSADGVQGVVTRDSAGQFPDQNAAEAVRRLSGVNVLNDQGEGRFIAVRGLDPNLNAASINGVRTPSPEADIRSVALDVIPTELVESIEVKKTLTPDMDADTIGASIEINTTSSLERSEPYLGIKLEGGYNDKSTKVSPKASVDFSTMLTDRLGVAGGISYNKRKFETDNVEMEGWNVADGITYADTVQYRDYDVTRTRIGASLSFDYIASDNTDLYLRGLYSRFDDQEYRRRLIFDMEDATPVSGSSTTANFDSAAGERFTVIRDLKDRFERQTITSLVAGGETHADAWTFDYSASYSLANEKEDGSLDPARFRQRFTGSGSSRGTVSFDYSDLGKPSFDFGTGEANFLNASRYSFYRLEETDLSDSEDEEWGLKADITRSFGLDQGQFDLKFGAKARLRQKDYDKDINYYDGITGSFTLANVIGDATYDIADIDPVPSKNGVASYLVDNRGRLTLSDLDTLYESSIADYNVDEDIYAAYVMGRYESGPLLAIGGLRMEHTRDKVAGNLVELVAEGGTHNGVTLDEDTVFVTPTGQSKDYTDWLPSLSLRYEAQDDVLLRAGVFRSVVRPGIGKIAPRFVVEESEDGEREGEFGNPDLDPYRAWNFDLSAEWYPVQEAVLSGGFFYKTIKDYIVDATFENGTLNGIAYDEATIPINGDEATVKGFEANYQQSLLFLPEPFDGLLFSLNYTYTDAKGDVQGRSIPLPASSKNTLTGLLGYEKGPISLRVAATYRSGYLDELGASAEEDRYVKDHMQWDVTAKYKVNDNIQLFTELVNLGDEPYVAYQQGPNGDRLLQYEEYGWTGKLGVRLTY